MTVDVLEFLTGWPNVLRLDPTDLLALPALLIAWWIWRQAATRSIRFPIAAGCCCRLPFFATMADSAAPNPGIDCLEQVGSQILILSLLAGETLAALAVFALAAGTMAPGRSSRKVRLLLVLGWLALCGTVGFKIMFLQGNYSQLGSQLSAYGAIVAGVIAASVAVIRLTAVFRLNPTAVWATLGLSALAALLFMMPFIVWSQNGIPYYVAAVGYAAVLVVVTCFVGQRYLRRYVSAPQDLTTA